MTRWEVVLITTKGQSELFQGTFESRLCGPMRSWEFDMRITCFSGAAPDLSCFYAQYYIEYRCLGENSCASLPASNTCIKPVYDPSPTYVWRLGKASELQQRQLI
jgi:hypothetical protein